MLVVAYLIFELIVNWTTILMKAFYMVSHQLPFLLQVDCCLRAMMISVVMYGTLSRVNVLVFWQVMKTECHVLVYQMMAWLYVPVVGIVTSRFGHNYSLQALFLLISLLYIYLLRYFSPLSTSSMGAFSVGDLTFNLWKLPIVSFLLLRLLLSHSPSLTYSLSLSLSFSLTLHFSLPFS